MEEGEGKRPHSQPPAGIHPLSTRPSSLTTPLALTHLSHSLSSPPSSPRPPSNSSPSSLSTPFLPHQRHQLQQHQLHHHQQLLLQQQHLHKQRLLQQQTQQLACELQLKLKQQQVLQQEHPKLLEQFKQHLQQEQICASPSFDSQSSPVCLWPQEQENLEDQARGEYRRNALSRRCRHDRSKQLSCDLPPEEHFTSRNSRFKSEEGETWSHPQASNVQAQRSAAANGQEELLWLRMEDADGEEGEPGAKRPKLSVKHLDGDLHVRSPPRSSQNPAFVLQEPVVGVGGVHQTLKNYVAFANGLQPPRLASGSSPAALLDALDLRRVPQALKKLQPHLKPVSEGTGLKGGTAADPSSKSHGGCGKASVPGKKVLRGILDKLQKKDSYGAFSEPVDVEEVPDYYDVIKEPMDFGTMRKRISSNFYTSLELFQKDIFAISNNAMTFNAAGTVYYRQARAIKLAAERILDALKTSGLTGADVVLNQKIGGSDPKKSHKKKQPLKSWTSDYVTEPSLNVGGRAVGQVSAAPCQADSYYVDWQRFSAQTSKKVNADYREDPTGCLAKSLESLDGRRWQMDEESRRSSYRPYSTSESSSLMSTASGPSLQFVPAAFQLEFSYARSLARFAAELGPEVWKVARYKIRRALPMDIPFGPGWVGQQEAPGRPVVSMMNKTPIHDGTDSDGRMEHFPGEIGFPSVQRVGNDHVPDGAVGVVGCKVTGMTADRMPMTSSLDCTGTTAARCGLHNGDSLSERDSISQFASQTTSRDSSVRDTEHQPINSDGVSGTRQHLLSYPAQAASGCDAPCNFEVDPILIPGRDLDGRHCLDYTNVQSYGLQSGQVSASVAPINGVQSLIYYNG